MTKNKGTSPGRLAWIALLVAPLAPLPAAAQHASVRDTVHNLSVSGPGSIKSQSEQEICKFCHIPHNAVVPAPLWGHALSADKTSYRTAPVRKGKTLLQAPQPDGSSRLCLSCHDGTVALGDIKGLGKVIPMRGGPYLRTGDRGYIGTDLSGSHPVSFVVTDDDAGAGDGVRDIGMKPLAAIHRDPDVRLDSAGKMQCTTCHDPHADRFYSPGTVPRFWVKPTTDEVCVTCHVLR